MNARDVQIQSDRIAEFKKLDYRHNQLRALIHSIEGPDRTGPAGQGPFTSNTRESRSVDDIEILFTPTLGGSDRVRLKLDYLNIRAPDFGAFLLTHLRAQLKEVEKAMEAL